MEKNNGQKFDFLDYAATKNLTSYESRVFLTILKCYLVYNSGGVIISRSRICQSTSLQDGHVSRAVSGLIQKKIIKKSLKNGLPFYSFTPPIQGTPIREGVPPIKEGPPPPIEVKKPPIREGVIKDSNKDINNNIASKENKTQEKDSKSWKEETEKRFRFFFALYPGAWHKGIELKALGQFLNSTQEEQDDFIKAVKNYAKSKPVQEKKILSPLNFLQSPKIIAQYSSNTPAQKSTNNFDSKKIEQWKADQEKDPPRRSLKEDFEKLVTQTAGKQGGKP